uniref:Alpha-soluble NSF attachment protein n=1 Tax=Panagrellus redivivus TaxID=6233 RepID=A0A7E4VSN2_PANRE
MTDNEAKARAKLAEAEKKAKKGGFLGFLSSTSPDEIADLYIQAGNLFKIAKKWKEAGQAFERAAGSYDADGKHNTAMQYGEAGNCYRKVDPEKAVESILRAAEIYTDMGRFTMAAKNHTTVAEIYDSEAPNKEKAMEHYAKAADFYKGEEQRSTATKSLEKVGAYAAELGQLRKAIETFEEIAVWQADHSTLKYAAKNNFFKALLCYLNLDALDTQHALKRYEDQSPSFSESRECKLIKELVTAIEAGDADGFSDAVKQYDKISRLDDWATHMLLQAKKKIPGAAADSSHPAPVGDLEEGDLC